MTFEAQPLDSHFPPCLRSESRTTVDTATAAYYLNRRAQTLQKWACLGTGPITPKRVYGRLAWPVSEIRKLLEVTE